MKSAALASLEKVCGTQTPTLLAQMKVIVQQELERANDSTTERLNSLHVQELHPSTKNHYLWDTITKIRNARMERKVSAVFNGSGTASREAVLAMLKVAEGRGSNEAQEVQDMTDMLSAYSKLAVKRYIDEVGMALRHEMTSAERIEKMVSALEDYLHGQDSEQLKCLFEPNKLTKKKRDSLVATVGRLQKAQARMNQGIVARG